MAAQALQCVRREVRHSQADSSHSGQGLQRVTSLIDWSLCEHPVGDALQASVLAHTPEAGAVGFSNHFTQGRSEMFM